MKLEYYNLKIYNNKKIIGLFVKKGIVINNYKIIINGT